MFGTKRGFLLFSIFLLILTSSCFAWGPSSSYHSERPLILAPGDIKNITMSLQNMIGDQNVTINVDIQKGKDIAILKDPSNIYEVPLGRNDVKINMEVSIPKNTPIGTDYVITVFFNPVSVNQAGGLIQIVGAIEVSIPVLVRSETDSVVYKEQKAIEAAKEAAKKAAEPPKKNIPFTPIISLLIFVGIIMFIIFSKNKNSPQTTSVQTKDQTSNIDQTQESKLEEKAKEAKPDLIKGLQPKESIVDQDKKKSKTKK